MRRVFLAVTLSLTIAVTVSAQMRGGMGAGAVGGVRAGGMMSAPAGVRSGRVMSGAVAQRSMAASSFRGGVRVISPRTHPARSFVNRPFFRTRNFSPFNTSFCDGSGVCFTSAFFGGFHHRHPFPTPGFGFGFGTGLFGASWPYSYAGYWPYDGSWDMDQQAEQAQQYAQAQAAENAQLQNDLQDERLRQMKLEQQLADARSAQTQRRPAPQPARATEAPAPATVLVFRDGHQAEIKNYAIAGGKLYEFGTDFKRTILLSDLDVSATTKANDDRGVTFHVPGKKQ
jgi:hypothetical protein